jgi:hypothetical protein
MGQAMDYSKLKAHERLERGKRDELAVGKTTAGLERVPLERTVMPYRISDEATMEIALELIARYEGQIVWMIEHRAALEADPGWRPPQADARLIVANMQGVTKPQQRRRRQPVLTKDAEATLERKLRGKHESYRRDQFRLFRWAKRNPHHPESQVVIERVRAGHFIGCQLAQDLRALADRLNKPIDRQLWWIDDPYVNFCDRYQSRHPFVGKMMQQVRTRYTIAPEQKRVLREIASERRWSLEIDTQEDAA